ncbi:pyrroline-5-carboxylate reductase [Magnetococcales bacterium HHB-1]
MLLSSSIGFIGGGNMAEAIISGLIQAGLSSANIHVSDPLEVRRDHLENRYNVCCYSDNGALLEREISALVLAVKPLMITSVCQKIAAQVAPDMPIISIAAGVTLHQMMQHFPAKQPMIRVMPNTPALIQKGISVYCRNKNVSDAQRHLVQEILNAVGSAEEIKEESLMDAVTALSGSGPAYLFLIAEALSDGGVACGLPRPLADKLAIETLIGSSELLKQSGEHPGTLKNQVTSPGGTTIAGLKQLELAGTRGALMTAVDAAWKRSLELTNA